MPDRESMFSRLFRYAKGDPNVALENYTTEALRSAIEADPAPMLRALRGVVLSRHAPGCSDSGRDRLPADLIGDAVGLVPRTQVAVPKVGTVDLVLELPGRPAEVWVEVKIGAPETITGSGDPGQLTRYRQFISGSAEATPNGGIDRALVTLSGRQFACTAWLRWESLWVAVHSSPDRSQMWDDLLEFLKEEGVADESLMPMSAREAAALGDAVRLLNKAAKVLAEVHRQGHNQWGPILGWYEPSQVRSSLYAPLTNTGTLRLPAAWQGDAAWIYTGLVERDGEAYWSASVEMVKRAPEVREGLLKLAGGLASEIWTVNEHGDLVVGSFKRAAELYTHENAVTWLLARLDDLANVGIIDAIAQTQPDEPRRKGVVSTRRH